jgi:ABC-type transporter MlaC component
LRFTFVACAILALALASVPNAQAAPQAPAANAAVTPEAKAAEVVARIRQLAVEIERETAPREVERGKFNELKSLIDGEAIALFVLGEKLGAATAPQRTAFVSALSDLVADGLVERLGGAHAEPFELEGARTIDNWRHRRGLACPVQGRTPRRARLAPACQGFGPDNGRRAGGRRLRRGRRP